MFVVIDIADVDDTAGKIAPASFFGVSGAIEGSISIPTSMSTQAGCNCSRGDNTNFYLFSCIDAYRLRVL